MSQRHHAPLAQRSREPFTAVQSQALETERTHAVQPDLLTRGVLGAGGIAPPQAMAARLTQVSGGRLSHTRSALLQLQRQYGNRYVQRVVQYAGQAANPAPAPVIQTKLVVGPAKDQYEQEADRVAEYVMSTLASGIGQSSAVSGQATVQRAKLKDEDAQRVQTNPLAASITRVIRRAAGEDSVPELVQRDVEMPYGTWKTEKYEPWVGDGSGEGDEADRRGCAMQLAFHPKDTVDAKKIGLVQQLKSTVGGKVEGLENPASQIHASQAERNVPLTEGVGGGHRIDRGPGEYVPVYGAEVPELSKKKDWSTIKVAIPETQLGYRHKLPGRNAGYTTKAAKLLDTPNRRNAETNSSMEFETTALAVEGVQANTYYGSVKWGWKTDGAGKHELIPLSTVSEGKPSGEFMAAAEQWNKVEGAKGFPLPIQKKALVQHREAPTGEEGQPVLRSVVDGFEAGNAFEQRLQSLRGGGVPLPGGIRAELEPRFGADFSSVRVHTGGEAAQLNRMVGAQAFTYGKDIYLGQGRTNLESNEGKHLLTHELTHTIQQGAVPRKAP